MIYELSGHLYKKGVFLFIHYKKGKLDHIRNKLLFSTALVAAAFAASNALADNTYKEYEAGSVISADDLGHEAGDNRISFMGDATLEKDVTMGNFVTLQEKTKLDGGYESDGGYLGNKTLAEGKSTIDIQGNIKLDNNARIVAATTSDKGTVNITNAPNITLTNGSSIDAVTLKIDGGENRTAINISGNNPEAGREDEKDEQWRNNAYILGYGESNISNADITIGAGGMLIQGATGDGTKEADKHSMTLTNSYVNVAKDGLMKSTNGSDFA